MKVLQVVNSLGFGGAEKLVVEMSILLKKAHVDVEILLINRSFMEYERELQENKIIVNSLDVNHFYNPVVICKLMKYMKVYDLIHVHLFPMQYWVVLAKLLSFSSIPLITTEHSTDNRRRHILGFRILDRIIYKYYCKIISISSETQNELCHYLKQTDSRFLVINNGINVDNYRASSAYIKEEFLHVDSSIKIVTMVGLFRQAKDQDTLIRALKYLNENVHLVLVGAGERENILKSLVCELNLEKRVHFLGRRKDVAAIMQMSDIIVQSSHWEGFGLAALEGMATGKPVVASNVSGLADIVKGAGLLFSPHHEKQLAEILSRLLSDAGFYAKISNCCFQRAQLFDQSRMIQAYINIYKSVISKI